MLERLGPDVTAEPRQHAGPAGTSFVVQRYSAAEDKSFRASVSFTAGGNFAIISLIEPPDLRVEPRVRGGHGTGCGCPRMIAR